MRRFFSCLHKFFIADKAWLWIILLTAADQISKFWIIRYLEQGRELPLLPFLSFYHTQNKGIAFSMLSDQSNAWLIILTIIIIAAVAWLLWKNRAGCLWQRTGYLLILGGALGNLADRIRLHYVTDFILFHIGSWSFAVFNLADAFISLGFVCILIHEYFQSSLFKRAKS